MIIEGDENTGRPDLVIPEFLDAYVNIGFKFKDITNGVASFLAEKPKGWCLATVDARYVTRKELADKAELLSLVEMPGSTFEVAEFIVNTWSKIN